MLVIGDHHPKYGWTYTIWYNMIARTNQQSMRLGIMGWTACWILQLDPSLEFCNRAESCFFSSWPTLLMTSPVEQRLKSRNTLGRWCPEFVSFLSWYLILYPLVMTSITIEKNTMLFSWVNQLFPWSFSSSQTVNVYQAGYTKPWIIHPFGPWQVANDRTSQGTNEVKHIPTYQASWHLVT